MKEYVYRSMRNHARQRRSMKRFFEDLNILVAEANFADEKLLGRLG